MLTVSGCLTAQELKSGYINWGVQSTTFHTTLIDWKVGGQVNEDDNFFISRVKPHVRFRNKATQVRQDIDSTTDKKLLAWLPVDEPSKNALPDGVFDSEVFSMWSYVTHWGDWTAPVGRVPGALLDVAHKNGVAVSSVAAIPAGDMTASSSYYDMLNGLASADATKCAKFFRYYGVDGIGYNSEFIGGKAFLAKLRTFHSNLVRNSRTSNPLFENIWYDGTDDSGELSFDKGLGSHNRNTFGNSKSPRTSLFFNYNWNQSTLMYSSVAYAESLGRDPLDLYAGINMQGGQPSVNNWVMLQNYRLSIGLWGAHSNNMFWESRNEKGSDSDTKQRTYLLRTERYFTGGTRNPVNTPEVSNSMQYNADNYSFHGMSKFMTARSALSWNLSEEPFITHFNLGNGKFFNYDGVRQNDLEWYNIGVQDYLPTWRWWFATKLLGNASDDVPASGLDAEMSWDEAYLGGSSMRVFGSHSDEYLHLFKTKYALKSGDVVTVRYKHTGGKADVDLVLSAEGTESQGVSYGMMKSSDALDGSEWTERKFTIGTDFDGKTLAMVALHFKNASNVNLYLGELSVVRGESSTPSVPEITRSQMLSYSKAGIDAKVIFNMANDKAAGEPCYNLDVKTSMFKVYAQQEGKDPVLMGATTSWAAMIYSFPVDFSVASQRIRLGVSAVSLDMKSESDIAWTEYETPSGYVYDDDITVDKKTIKPGESFSMSYVDEGHESGTWSILDADGNEVFNGSGRSVTVGGLPAIGNYSLQLTGYEYDADGGRTQTVRDFDGLIQVTGDRVGALPEIFSLTANGEELDITVKAGDTISLAYTGRVANGVSSRGVSLGEKHFGFKAEDLGLTDGKSFSIAFWIKINKLIAGETELFSVLNKKETWPKTDWGWAWVDLTENGGISSYAFSGDETSGQSLQYGFAGTKIPVGNWAHIAMTFDYNAADSTFRSDFYVNGKRQTVTSCNRTSAETENADPGYVAGVDSIRTGDVVAIGGDAYSRNGIDGVIDNLVVWNKAITAEDVERSMGDIDQSHLPDGVLAFWNLEEKASENGTFKSVGSLEGAEAGMHSYTSEGGEGQGTFHWDAPEYTSGCPFLSDSAYVVETVPSWSTSNGIFFEENGGDVSGVAKLKYTKEGDYTVTLTLTNSLGSDQQTFQVIKVAGISSDIESAVDNRLKTYVVGEEAYIEFADRGHYNVSVYDTTGRKVTECERDSASGNIMKLRLGAAGTYIVRISESGKHVRTVKLVRK